MAKQTNVRPAISDSAVRESTGLGWNEWFADIDAAGGMQMSHKQIVAWLRDETTLSRWWQQMVAVSYEQVRGKREKHQKPDGFQISVAKTMNATKAWLFSAWKDPRLRQRWFTDDITMRATREMDSLRMTMSDGTWANVRLQSSSREGRVSVTITHGGLRDAQQAEEMKGYWRAALQRLAELD
jgi:uncharacterized protein YndB with AHSA1/START domain